MASQDSLSRRRSPKPPPSFPIKLYSVRLPASVTTDAHFPFTGTIGGTTNLTLLESCEPLGDSAWSVTEHLFDERQFRGMKQSCQAESMREHFGGWDEGDGASRNCKSQR